MKRLREIDFLRGIAILLVFLRHIHLFSYTENLGWIGVDLFFVLSGFLVSGLLFKEYIKFGNIQPKLFLIRRGFKIYPIYYLFYFLYIPFLFKHNKLHLIGFLSDMSFTQNYIWGTGYAYPASWSLAVEEHFYFGLAISLWFGLKHNLINLRISNNNRDLNNRFYYIVLILLAIVFLLRIYSNINFPHLETLNFTMTHLRIDSLLFGVFISYLYYFKNDYLKSTFQSNQILFFVICICGLIWTPFINPVPSFFVKTFGFSLLYISFGIILIVFLFKKNINETLNNLFSEKIVNLISKIGYCSYSIYIIHTFILMCCSTIVLYLNCNVNKYLFFIIVSILSIITGMFMTYNVEKYFLRIRNKYYPSRI